jgi:hypothetical protein
MPHSCAVVPLDAHFARSEPLVRETFDAYLDAARAFGPVIVNATKSRIAFQARGRFAGVDAPRRAHLVASFLLTRPVRSDRLSRVEFVPPYYYVHRLRLSRPDDVDAELQSWLAEAYRVGAQEHVDDPGWPKERYPPDWVAVPREVADSIGRGDDPSRVRRRRRGPA